MPPFFHPTPFLLNICDLKKSRGVQRFNAEYKASPELASKIEQLPTLDFFFFSSSWPSRLLKCLLPKELLHPHLLG